MKKTVLFAFLAMGVLMLFVANVVWGAIHIPCMEIWNVVTGKGVDEFDSYVILGFRLSQAFVALWAGAALAVGGLLLQTLFSNPLADASVLGIHSGASVGASLVVLLWGGGMASLPFSGNLLLVLMAFAGAMGVIFCLVVFSSVVRSNSLLLIVGLMLGYVLSSVISLLCYLSSASGLQAFFAWGMGSFSNVTDSQLPLFSIAVVVGLLSSFLLIKPLNALLVGENYARNLGVSIRRTRLCILCIVGWFSAVVTAFCGPIAFIGLAVPHFARMLFRTTNHVVLLPATLLLGAGLSLVCNLLCSVLCDMQLPLNVVTPFFGVPVVLYILVSYRKTNQ